MGRKDFHPLLCALFAWVAVLSVKGARSVGTTQVENFINAAWSLFNAVRSFFNAVRNLFNRVVGAGLGINASGYNDNLQTKPALTQHVQDYG
jgi:hypothetical protein